MWLLIMYLTLSNALDDFKNDGVVRKQARDIEDAN